MQRRTLPFTVNVTSAKTLLLAVALFATSSGMHAADAAKDAKPTSNADMQKLVEQFTARRDALLANREALMTQLKNATAEQRKAILEKMQSQQKDLVEAQRALGRQLRDEMRKLREATPANPGRR